MKANYVKPVLLALAATAGPWHLGAAAQPAGQPKTHPSQWLARLDCPELRDPAGFFTPAFQGEPAAVPRLLVIHGQTSTCTHWCSYMSRCLHIHLCVFASTLTCRSTYVHREHRNTYTCLHSESVRVARHTSKVLFFTCLHDISLYVHRRPHVFLLCQCLSASRPRTLKR